MGKVDPWQHVEDEVQAFLGEKSAGPLPSLTPAEKRKGSADLEEQQPAKKIRPPIVADQHEFELSQNRKAIVRTFNGKILVDVREFYTTKDGEAKPAQKGLAMSQSQWATLRSHLGEISQAVQAENCDYLLELGNNRRATVGTYKGSLNVNLREYYEKEGELAPGKKGIALAVEEWEAVVAHADSIDAAVGKPEAPEAPSPSNGAGTGASSTPGAPAEAAATGEEEHADFIELSQNRRISLSDYKGVTRLDVREYYSKDGKMLPGKKGISLPRDQAAKLEGAMGDLSAALEEKREKSVALGPSRYAKVKAYKGKHSVDVREYYQKDGAELPGQKGLSLTAEQWKILCQHLPSFIHRM